MPADESQAPEKPRDEPFGIFEVFNDYTSGDQHGVSFRIRRKLLEKDLLTILNSVRKEDEGKWRRTFVDFYLPRLRYDIEEEPWALVSYAPELKIEFNHPSIEEEAKLREIAARQSPDVLGCWLTKFKTVDMIYFDDNKPKLVTFF